MRIELYKLASGSSTATSYESLGSLESEATPTKDSIIYYSDKFYTVKFLVISSNRIVAFVDVVNGQQLGIAKVFQM